MENDKRGETFFESTKTQRNSIIIYYFFLTFARISVRKRLTKAMITKRMIFPTVSRNIAATQKERVRKYMILRICA